MFQSSFYYQNNLPPNDSTTILPFTVPPAVINAMLASVLKFSAEINIKIFNQYQKYLLQRKYYLPYIHTRTTHRFNPQIPFNS